MKKIFCFIMFLIVISSPIGFAENEEQEDSFDVGSIQRVELVSKNNGSLTEGTRSFSADQFVGLYYAYDSNQANLSDLVITLYDDSNKVIDTSNLDVKLDFSDYYVVPDYDSNTGKLRISKPSKSFGDKFYGRLLVDGTKTIFYIRLHVYEGKLGLLNISDVNGNPITGFVNYTMKMAYGDGVGFNGNRLAYNGIMPIVIDETYKVTNCFYSIFYPNANSGSANTPVLDFKDAYNNAESYIQLGSTSFQKPTYKAEIIDGNKSNLSSTLSFNDGSGQLYLYLSLPDGKIDLAPIGERFNNRINLFIPHDSDNNLKIDKEVNLLETSNEQLSFEENTDDIESELTEAIESEVNIDDQTISKGGIEVEIPSFKVTLNGSEYDSNKAEYPLIIFDSITYFPMTWNLSKSLGLTTTYTEESGLSIELGKSSGTLSYLENENTYSSKEQALLPKYNINVMGNNIENSSEAYPILTFKDITYFPLTWQYAVEEFNWKYNFSSENGLTIESQD